MPGIGQVLNIAKEALLAHQQSVSVASHNIANVDTPGYTRQTLSLKTSIPTPEGVGFFGTGVRGEEIQRHYDQFMVKRLTDQNSLLKNLEAQQESLRLVETSFNEAPGLAVNELMSEFWASWQTISNDPEIMPTRSSAVQQAQIIVDKFHSMAAEIAQTRTDIDTRLDSAVNDVNTLTSQLAALNGQIAASETDLNQQNDLRDQRDTLLNELSQYMEINYFEIHTGAYTIMMGDGHTLVENNASWQVDWADDELQWVSTSVSGDLMKVPVGDGAELGGRIGGWMETYNNLTPGNPENYLGRLDALANALIREINQQHSQGVGLTLFSTQLTSNDPAANTVLLTSTVDPLLATDTIQAGSLNINGRDIGKIEGATATYGRAQTKAYNAVQAINAANTGVRARLTTQVAGNAVNAMTVGDDGTALTFQINGVAVSYTVDSNSVPGPPPGDDRDPTIFAQNVVDEINAALVAHNDPTATPQNIPKITITAELGTGANGGALNSIVLKNSNAGDESNIVISGIDTTSLENNLGLGNGTYEADATHNTGELHLFSHDSDIEIESDPDDRFLDQLGLGGGLVSSTDEGGDGQLVFTAQDHQVLYAMQGYDYSDELITDGGSFKIWIYNKDAEHTLAYPQPIEAPMDRVYDLQDVADAINIAITNTTGHPDPWGVYATIHDNKLVLTPDSDHQFAFAEDTSNFLATAGLNTFFTGSDATDIGINSLIAGDVDLGIVGNLNYINAGKIQEDGDFFPGDEKNALEISDIQRNEYVRFTGSTPNTMDGFYNCLVGDIGLKGKTVQRDYEYNELVTIQMEEMRDSTSGVSLDEEMADLIKYQHAYSAAAKLITSSDEMMRTLLEAV